MAVGSVELQKHSIQAALVRLRACKPVGPSRRKSFERTFGIFNARESLSRLGVLRPSNFHVLRQLQQLSIELYDLLGYAGYEARDRSYFG